MVRSLKESPNSLTCILAPPAVPPCSVTQLNVPLDHSSFCEDVHWERVEPKSWEEEA